MAADDFAPPKAPGVFEISVRGEQRRTQFGDGYSVRSTQGMINTTKHNVQLRWPMLSEAQGDSLITTLEGYITTSFLYTVPGQSGQRRYTVDANSIKRSLDAKNFTFCSIEVLFIHEFDL